MLDSAVFPSTGSCSGNRSPVATRTLNSQWELCAGSQLATENVILTVLFVIRFPDFQKLHTIYEPLSFPGMCQCMELL